ncbi:hypothetical protein ACN38_g659 [Penicillium nordicum]|uniref:Uncharacterized protein n=1 Tax=Penicillium nordicum TaxID=229535 RepID=A0A0M9WKL0_9EURO|nr:hypothetical protein ACN38_g659 [Penicillium nordicum]
MRRHNCYLPNGKYLNRFYLEWKMRGNRKKKKERKKFTGPEEAEYPPGQSYGTQPANPAQKSRPPEQQAATPGTDQND